VRFLRRPHAHHTSSRRRFYARLVALALLIAYAVAFILENGKAVSVHFVFGTAHVSLVWLILLSIAVGLLGGLLLPRLERRWSRRSHESAQPGDAV
jgi:uncharacterized integral membrane protein